MLPLSKQNAYRERYKALRPGWRTSGEEFEALTRQHIGPGARVLDLGCGRGGVMELFWREVRLSVGLDPDHASLVEHRIHPTTSTLSGTDAGQDDVMLRPALWAEASPWQEGGDPFGRLRAGSSRKVRAQGDREMPLVCGFGDQHFKVEKEVTGDRTVTRVHPLEGAARVAELALMLGGAGEKTTENAEEILEMVRAEKAAAQS